jgi:serine/threonine-protein kinase
VDRRRLIELFDRAIELPPDERSRLLDAECADDAQLRAEVERLLRADERSSRFLEKPPAIIAATRDAITSDEFALPHFDGWRTLKRIGAGGVGEVWLAERDGEFVQRAAIKQLMHPTPGLKQRFRQERQILARLQHPNIARLIDGGVDSAGMPYFAMEYIEGTPIVDFIRARALDVRARLQLFIRVCDAVQYAHQNLVVHRDLKPSNILVDADGNPKLLDFGIAKLLETSEGSAPTQTIGRMLTPEYAAPEQFGDGAITTATDVYSLGVVLYELLAGMRPSRNSQARSAGDNSIQPPSAAATQHARELRGDLDRIVATALAIDPSHRYASVEALSADIQRHLDGHPISIRRDSAWYRLRKFTARNRYAVAATLLVVIVCIAAAAISLQQANVARAQTQRANTVRQFLSNVFAQINPDQNKGVPITAHQLLEIGEAQLDRERVSNPAIRGDVGALLGRLYRDVGDRERAWQMLQTALAANAEPRVPNDVRARVLLGVASAECEDRDAFDDALTHARQALALLETTQPRDNESIADAHRIIGLSLIRRGENEAAATLLDTSAAQDAQSGERNESLADEYVLKGVALGNLARFDQSDIAFVTGSTMLRDMFGERSNRYAYALNEMAQMLGDKADWNRAEELQRKVLDIHLATLGPDHFNTLTARHNLIGIAEQQGHFKTALPERLALLEKVQALPSATPLQKARQYDTVSVDYRESNRFAESEAASRKALEIIEGARGKRSTSSIVPLRHLAQTLALEDRIEEADTVFHDALSISLEHGTNTSLMACALRRDLGSNLRRRHQAEAAVAQLASLTTDACMVGLSETDTWRPVALADLSLSQLDAGHNSDALATAESAVRFGRKAIANSYVFASPLLAHGRAALAAAHASDAEASLREALELRRSVYEPDDLRMIETEVALVECLRVLQKNDEAEALAAATLAKLQTSKTGYAAELRDRLEHSISRGI